MESAGPAGHHARRTSVRTRGHVARPAGRPLANRGCVGRGAAAAHRVSVRAGPGGWAVSAPRAARGHPEGKSGVSAGEKTVC